MSVAAANKVFSAEFKDHLCGAPDTNDVRIDICDRIAGDFERERLAPRVSIIFAELLKVVGYLTSKSDRCILAPKRLLPPLPRLPPRQ
jgi:hypothetical protein